MSQEALDLMFAPDLVLLGDGSQYIFLSWLLPASVSEHFQGKPVYVRRGRFSISLTGDCWTIYTPKLLPHMTVYLPAEGQPWEHLVTQTHARYAVFEEHPFNKELEPLQCLEQSASHPEVLLVLVDIPRRQGATDLPEEQSGLEHRLERCAAQGQAVTVAKPGRWEDITRVLHWHEPLRNRNLRILKQEVAQLRQRQQDLDFEFDALKDGWELENGILSPDLCDKIEDARGVERSRKTSIWDCYTDKADKLLFPSGRQGALFDLARLYMEYVQQGVWENFPFDQDEDILIRRMKAKLSQRLSAGFIAADKPEPFTKEAYLAVVSQTKLIDHFQTCIKAFITEDALSLTQELLEQRCLQLERSLSDGVLV